MSNLPAHTQAYIDYFGLEEGDFIACEITGGQAVDIHHIEPKQMGGKKTFILDEVEYDINDIINLIAVTREAHDDCHNGTYSKEELYALHKRVIRNHKMNTE